MAINWKGGGQVSSGLKEKLQRTAFRNRLESKSNTTLTAEDLHGRFIRLWSGEALLCDAGTPA